MIHFGWWICLAAILDQKPEVAVAVPSNHWFYLFIVVWVYLSVPLILNPHNSNHVIRPKLRLINRVCSSRGFNNSKTCTCSATHFHFFYGSTHQAASTNRWRDRLLKVLDAIRMWILFNIEFCILTLYIVFFFHTEFCVYHMIELLASSCQTDKIPLKPK